MKFYDSWIVKIEPFFLLTLAAMYFFLCKTVIFRKFLKVSEKYFPQCGAEIQIKGVDITGNVWEICKEKSK